MIGLVCKKKHETVTNHDNEYDNGDNGRNKDRNDGNNATSGSGSNGPISDPIMTLWSRLGLMEEDRERTVKEM